MFSDIIPTKRLGAENKTHSHTFLVKKKIAIGFILCFVYFKENSVQSFSFGVQGNMLSSFRLNFPTCFPHSF